MLIAGTPFSSTTPSPTTPSASPTASLTISTSTLTSAGGSITLRYSSTHASTCSLFSSPAFWSGSDPTTVSCVGATSATVVSNSVERQWTFTFTATNASGQSANSTQTLEQAALTPSFWHDTHWSGYAVPSDGALITDVSGEWTVPTVDCADTPNAYEATWVGTGESGSAGDLLQTGTGDECVDGIQQAYAWWEEYPEVIPSIIFSYLQVSPGDSIEASVYRNATGQWVTRVDDLTMGLSGWMITGDAYGVGTDRGGTFTTQGSTTSLTYSGGYTAEWIVEDPATVS